MSLQTIPIPAGLQTHTFVLGKGTITSLPELLKLCFPGKRPWIVADDNTWKAAGAHCYDLLYEAGMNPALPFLFPCMPKIHPEYSHSQDLAELMRENYVPVAVGSGVVNDLVKCAAGILKERYCCVPTACSVDGFTSAGGSMTVNGFKKTVPCPAPYALCADTDILKTAPAPMFAAGYADLLAKIPGGADWVIADTLGIEPIAPAIWELIQKKLRFWLSDCTNMANVFDGLAATGYSMQMYKDSRPASGCEHMFSHIWEMEGLTYQGDEPSHGFKVAIGSLISVSLMEYVIQHDFEDLRSKQQRGLSIEERTVEIIALLKRGCYGDGAAKTALSKHLTGDALQQRRALIEEKWPILQKRMQEQLFTYEETLAKLRQANCPTRPQEIGLTQEQFLHAIPTAQLIRNRYTVLDLLYEAGLLQDAISFVSARFPF